VVQALPALRPLQAIRPEELGVEHTRWFTHELSPHAAAFLDGALNGPTTASVRATWTAAGFGHGRTDLEDDHLAVHLAALSFLCAAELEAREDGVDPEPVLRLQQRVLGPMQSWLPLLAHGVEGPWACVVQLAAELVDDHAEVDQGPLHASESSEERVKATDLLVPGTAGWVPTWTVLTRLGEAAGCPLGFGSKRRSLRLLLDNEAGRAVLREALPDAGPEAWRPQREALSARV